MVILVQQQRFLVCPKAAADYQTYTRLGFLNVSKAQTEVRAKRFWQNWKTAR